MLVVEGRLTGVVVHPEQGQLRDELDLVLELGIVLDQVGVGQRYVDLIQFAVQILRIGLVVVRDLVVDDLGDGRLTAPVIGIGDERDVVLGDQLGHLVLAVGDQRGRRG